jgi:hypothetical protein
MATKLHVRAIKYVGILSLEAKKDLHLFTTIINSAGCQKLGFKMPPFLISDTRMCNGESVIH